MSRRETRNALRTLLTHQSGLTVAQIRETTGFAYNTVRYGLAAIGAESDGGYPAAYTLPASRHSEGTEEAIEARETFEDVRRTTKKTWLPEWNNELGALADSFSQFEVTPTSDPRKLSKNMMLMASLLVGFARRLDEVADEPAWFEALGGER